MNPRWSPTAAVWSFVKRWMTSRALLICWSGIGTVNLRMKKYPEALDSYNRALTLFERADHKAGAANTLSRIADTHLQQARLRSSLQFCGAGVRPGKAD